VWWIFSTGQLVVCCCCPCVAGQSTGCWDGLGDASSFGQGDGHESDRPKTAIAIISQTIKATDFKFGQYIRRVHPNKIPLKILEKRERGGIPGVLPIF